MPQSLASIHLHIVFSTKNRTPWLSKEVRPRAHAYIGGALRNIKCPATLIGGVEDHVHALVSMSRTVTVAKIVETMKSGSSRWMKDNGVPGFEWQAGYGAFSVGPEGVQLVVQYIDRQEEHHRKVTFKDELLALLNEAGVEYDERYLWD